MKIWFDTEFYEDGQSIDLISIGLVREDGATYYAETETAQYDARRSDWLKANVLPHLTGLSAEKTKSQIRKDLIEFAGGKPEFWAYYASYDWVALCQIFGPMLDLPKGWPMFVRDIKMVADAQGNPKLPEQASAEHNALADAHWNREAWAFLFGEVLDMPEETRTVAKQVVDTLKGQDRTGSEPPHWG